MSPTLFLHRPRGSEAHKRSVLVKTERTRHFDGRPATTQQQQKGAALRPPDRYPRYSGTPLCERTDTRPPRPLSARLLRRSGLSPWLRQLNGETSRASGWQKRRWEAAPICCTRRSSFSPPAGGSRSCGAQMQGTVRDARRARRGTALKLFWRERESHRRGG